jgi:MOSC domain-containing protein YiiM
MTVLGDRPVPSPAARATAAGGRVVAIHIATAASGPMQAVDRVRAMAGVGLEGDRYALGIGHYSVSPAPDRQITLIAAEELERLASDHGIELAPGDSRRNVTTRGIDLAALVGRRFRIGEVECEGTRLCEPCQYLTDLLGKPVLGPLVHRAGLRARILTNGDIATGDEIVPGEAAPEVA